MENTRKGTAVFSAYCFMAMMAAMKKVRSPISARRIIIKLATKAAEKLSD